MAIKDQGWMVGLKIERSRLTSIGISIVKIRHYRLIFIIGIPIYMERQYLYCDENRVSGTTSPFNSWIVSHWWLKGSCWISFQHSMGIWYLPWSDDSHGPLARYVKLWVTHAPGMPGTFFFRHRLRRKTLVSDHDMHHGTSVTHVPLMHVGIAKLRWRGKRSRHSWRTHNP